MLQLLMIFFYLRHLMISNYQPFSGAVPKVTLQCRATEERISLSLFILKDVSMKIANKSETTEARFYLVCLFIQFCWGFKYFQIKNISGHWILYVYSHVLFFFFLIVTHAYWERRLLLAHCSAGQSPDLWICIRFNKTSQLFVFVYYFSTICKTKRVEFHLALNMYSMDCKFEWSGTASFYT